MARRSTDTTTNVESLRFNGDKIRTPADLEIKQTNWSKRATRQKGELSALCRDGFIRETRSRSGEVLRLKAGRHQLDQDTYVSLRKYEPNHIDNTPTAKRCNIRRGLDVNQTKKQKPVSYVTIVNDTDSDRPTNTKVRPNLHIRTEKKGQNHLVKQSESSVALSYINQVKLKGKTYNPSVGNCRQPFGRMASNYGKVSNPARPVGFSRGADQGDGSRNAQVSNTSSENTTSTQRHGSHTVIPPDAKRRNQILSQAEQEDKAYQAYRESRRIDYVKTTPQSVGGSKSEAEILRQRQREQSESKYRMQMKRREWEAQKKEREESEYRAKKERAREQARRNQQKKAERQGIWTEDHVRTNEMFLRRLEQRSHQN